MIIKAVGGKSLSAVTKAMAGQKLISLDNNYAKEYNCHNSFGRHIRHPLSGVRLRRRGSSPTATPNAIISKLPKIRFKKSFLLPLLFLFGANLAFAGECHCQNYIKDAFFARAKFDLTKQLEQMEIDQKNFAEHFVSEDMTKGLENELTGVLNSFNKTASTNPAYDEVIFYTEKLIKELEVTNRLGVIEMKSNLNAKEN